MSRESEMHWARMNVETLSRIASQLTDVMIVLSQVSGERGKDDAFKTTASLALQGIRDGIENEISLLEAHIEMARFSQDSVAGQRNEWSDPVDFIAGQPLDPDGNLDFGAPKPPKEDDL